MGRSRILVLPTSTLRKQVGQMQKLLGFWDKQKRSKESKSNPKPKPSMTHGVPDFLACDKGLNTKFVIRRQIVMNRHFTEIISDVLANNLKEDLSDIGVNITSIETKRWIEGVRVYYSLNKPFDQSLHDQLNSLAPKLRSAVSERQLTGRVPMINFVYDEAAELDRNLSSTLEKVRIPNSEEQTAIVRETSSDLQKPQDYERRSSKFMFKHFSGPEDMKNTALGINYPSLYDEVVSKLERGRAQSSRMSENMSLMAQQPMFRIPQDDTEEVDPTQRVQQMRKFLVSQRQKTEVAAKKRRVRELLHRDSIKWDVPEEEEETSEYF